MSLFKSVVRGFGHTLGRKAADNMTTRTGINSLWNLLWNFVKWVMIITFLIGVIQGLTS